ncbi:uncharacterized protein METZ01_LOCUS426635, partial [marine metagenome]
GACANLSPQCVEELQRFQGACLRVLPHLPLPGYAVVSGRV